MVDHAIATLALCEAYRITNAVVYRASAQSAIDCLEASLEHGIDGDESLAGWCVLALESARRGALNVNNHESGALFGELPEASPVSFLAGTLLDGKKDDERALDEWDAKASIDHEHLCFATLAIYEHDGPDGPRWRAWQRQVGAAVMQLQRARKDGCEEGSWSTDGSFASDTRGRVYATAINVLTLELYYRYSKVLGMEPHDDK
ncbi:hypothetical protein HY251_00345 [bacterium]|nr:hypothetical protein [bacterium]